MVMSQSDEQLGDNCIQIFHLGRYIVIYTVGNFSFTAKLVRMRKTWFPNVYPMINENFEYGYPHSNALL